MTANASSANADKVYFMKSSSASVAQRGPSTPHGVSLWPASHFMPNCEVMLYGESRARPRPINYRALTYARSPLEGWYHTSSVSPEVGSTKRSPVGCQSGPGGASRALRL